MGTAFSSTSGVRNRRNTGQPRPADTSVPGLRHLARFNNQFAPLNNQPTDARALIHDISHAVKALVEQIEREEQKPRLEAVAELRGWLAAEKKLSLDVVARVGSLLDLFEAEAELAATLSEKNIPGMENFPPEQLWRLFIDGHWQKKDCDIFRFEDERGYMAGMMNGFRAMLDRLRDRLDAEGYRELHDTCVDKVFPKPGNTKRSERPMDEGFRKDVRVRFGVRVAPPGVLGPQYNFTSAGYEELLEKSNEELGVLRGRLPEPRVQGSAARTGHPVCSAAKTGRPVYSTVQTGRGESPGDKSIPWNLLGVNERNEFTVFVCAPRSQDECAERTGQILDAYYEEIRAAEDDDGKLRAIVRCCRDLDQSHLFSDGNIRTVAFILLNKFLLENGMRPAIMTQPNAFDGYGLEELVAAVKKGQECVERLCGGETRLSPEDAQALARDKA